MTTTYPPDEHILRDLQIESWLEAPDHCIAEMAVTEPASFASLAKQAKDAKPLPVSRPVTAEKAARPVKAVKVRPSSSATA